MKKLLDVGCGPGPISNIGIYEKLKNEFNIFGIDPIKKNISLIKIRFPSGKFQIGKAEKLPYRKNYFDAITARHVLEHVDDPDKALEEIRRVSKTGSILTLAVPHEFFENVTSKITPHYIEKGHHHQRIFYKKTLIAILKKHGYKIESIRNDKWPFFVINIILSNLAKFSSLKMAEQTGIFLVGKKNYIRDKRFYNFYLLIYKFLSFLNILFFFLNFFIPFELHVVARKIK